MWERVKAKRSRLLTCSICGGNEYCLSNGLDCESAMKIITKQHGPFMRVYLVYKPINFLKKRRF